MSVRLPIFFKALENLGYRQEWRGWRRGMFHLIINEKKNHVIVGLHVDTPDFKVGPIHHSRYYGKDISEEFERIRKEYRRLRAVMQ